MRTKRRGHSDDWFSPRSYPHFDAPVTFRPAAEKVLSRFVANPGAHRFLPLVSFESRTRRWRRDPETGIVGEKWKRRALAYCSNSDAHIFAAVGWDLADRYEAVLAHAGLESVVVGYRRGLSNVTVARDAFGDVRRLGVCTTLALDVEDFFPSISHRVLKECWQAVLGEGLPPAHYAVFRALTRYSTVDRRACLKRLGVQPSLPSRKLPRPLCSLAQFQRLVRGRKPRGLIETNLKAHGIPQGTPISALAANVAMLDFDRAVSVEAARVGGTYRRYSDDILIISPPDAAEPLEAFVRTALTLHAGGLRLNEGKTSRVVFSGAPLPADARPMQYLGFLFDGQRVLLRPSTVSRFYGRMRRSVQVIKHDLARGHFAGSAIGGREVLQRRGLFRKFSNLGRDSLLRTYARVAGNAFERRAIVRQLRRHLRRLDELTRSLRGAPRKT